MNDTGKKVVAFVFGLTGGLLSLTGVGAIIGVPMILLAIGYYAESESEEDEDGEKEKPWWAKSMIPGVDED